MTKWGDDAFLTTYDNNGKNLKKNKLPHLLLTYGNDAAQCLAVSSTLARGGLTNNWVVGEGVALKAVSREVLRSLRPRD